MQKEGYACIKCMWNRFTPYKAAYRTPRYLMTFPMHCATGHPSHATYPFIAGVEIQHVHTCAMHAIMAFGKDLVVIIHLYILIKRETNPQIDDMVQRWMKKHNINVNFRYDVQNLYNCKELMHLLSDVDIKCMKKNIKATHTWELIQNWDDLMTLMQVDDPVRSKLVHELYTSFSILYKWCFVTEEDKDLLRIFAMLIPYFVPTWQAIMGRNKSRNYYHWLEVEALEVSKKQNELYVNYHFY
jgi:hypothetical protein